jgi:hypothetical protein
VRHQSRAFGQTPLPGPIPTHRLVVPTALLADDREWHETSAARVGIAAEAQPGGGGHLRIRGGRLDSHHLIRYAPL